MNLEMLAKMAHLRELLLADCAVMAFYSFVEVQMFLVGREMYERFSAFWVGTFIVRHIEVNSNVSFEMRGGEERLRAHVAGMIALIFVHLYVDVQVAAGLEGL